MILFIGMGKTGYDLAQYSLSNFHPDWGDELFFFDTRENPPYESQIKDLVKNKGKVFQKINSNQFNEKIIHQAKAIYLSPAIEPKKIKDCLKNDASFQSLIQQAKTDLDLFANWYIKENQCPQAKIIAITGTNGKSSVCQLLNTLCQVAKIPAKILGNFGPGFMHEIQSDTHPIVFILELSSFQLYYSKVQNYDIAAITNLYPEHLDWHQDFQSYQNAKIKIFEKASLRIDFNTYKKTAQALSKMKVFNLLSEIEKENSKLCFHIFSLLLKEINLDNQIELDEVFQIALHKNQALDFRNQKIASINGIDWINDSKSTNTHSLIAALKNISKKDEITHLWLVIGGHINDLKGLNFDDVAESIIKMSEYNHRVQLQEIAIFGSATAKIKSSFAQVKNIKISCFNNLQDALVRIHFNSQNCMKNKITSDSSKQSYQVLFSPGCSSLSSYKNYMKRGEKFNQIIQSFE